MCNANDYVVHIAEQHPVRICNRVKPKMRFMYSFPIICNTNLFTVCTKYRRIDTTWSVVQGHNSQVKSSVNPIRLPSIIFDNKRTQRMRVYSTGCI